MRVGVVGAGPAILGVNFYIQRDPLHFGGFFRAPFTGPPPPPPQPDPSPCAQRRRRRPAAIARARRRRPAAAAPPSLAPAAAAPPPSLAPAAAAVPLRRPPSPAAAAPITASSTPAGGGEAGWRESHRLREGVHPRRAVHAGMAVGS